MIIVKQKAHLFIISAAVMTLFIGQVPALANTIGMKAQNLAESGIGSGRRLIIKELYQQNFYLYDKELLRDSDSSISFDGDCISVNNMPEQLYLYRNFPNSSRMYYTTGVIYNIELKEETEYTIFSEINIGSLSFGILNGDTGEVVFEYREMGAEEDIKITLEAGNYEFLLSGQLSNGTFEINSGNKASE